MGFVELLLCDYLCLCVYECGVGWMLVCGIGVCVVMVVLCWCGEVDECVCVDLFGGMLEICWLGVGYMLWMCGLVVFVFEGEWLV